MCTTVLITTSGIGERLGEITKYTNKSLVKVGDKYAICYIIELYDDDTEFIVTIGYYGNYVKDFLLLAYPTKNITFVEIDLYMGEGSSLGYSMLQAKEYLNKPFIFHCCDAITLNKLMIEPNKNTLFVYPYQNSDNYTNILGNNGIVKEINLKKHKEYDFVYTGIASIHDYNLFWHYLKEIYENNHDTSLSDVNSIMCMIKNKILFNYTVLENWYDTGNVESYKQIQMEIKPIYYVIEKNYESLCFLNDKVIKFINDVEINKKRVIRGKHLYPLSPKIIGHSDNFVCMELIHGNVLSNMYEHKMIYQLLNWANQHLWCETKQNKEYIECCKRFYIDKTIHRLSCLHFLHNEKNKINGLVCKNVLDQIHTIPIELFTTDTFTKFHGDFILDNIIKTSDSYKLIDWRHEFDNQLYYGDIYYELAKLRHNIIFNHKNILDNLYDIEYTNDEVIVDLKCNYFLIQQLDDFERFVIENHYDLNKIKLLTAIIWLNMSPLYNGKLSEFLFYFGKYNLFRIGCNYLVNE